MLSITGLSSAQAVTSSPITTSVAPAAISVQTVVAPNPSRDTYMSQLLSIINEKRVAAGSKPVVWNQSIANVSQDWAIHLGEATKSPTFDWANIHRSDAGGSLIPSGATWYRENIAFNFSAASIVDWWMNSPGHKAAMLDPKATDIGFGYVVPTSGPYAGWHMVVSNLAQYPTSASVTAGTQYKTTITLNMRSGGGFEYPVIGSGATGTIVTATGKTSGVWYEVNMNGQTGWMSSDYLSYYAAAAISSISYSGHVQNIGWQNPVSNGGTAGTVGSGLRLESLNFSSSGQKARAHVQNIGWQDYRSGATTIGTSGQGLRMEAIQVQSTVPGEKILCQAHVENIGWMPEVGDGQVCGTEGKALRLEAVRLRVVK
jgi:uncharacterized protein YkwD